MVHQGRGQGPGEEGQRAQPQRGLWPSPEWALAKPRVGQGSGRPTSLCRQPWGLGYDGRQCDCPYKGVRVQSLPWKWLPRGS